MPADDVIFRLSPKGGPPPELEIIFHYQRVEAEGYTWVGLRRTPNAERIQFGSSRVYLISSDVQQTKTVLRGIVSEVREARPDDETIRDFYADHEFPAWYRLEAVECVRADFDALGLQMTGGKRYDTTWLRIRQPFNYLAQQNSWPGNGQDPIEAIETAGLESAEDLVAPCQTNDKPSVRIHATSTSGRMNHTIHAVDWSGGGDHTTPNKKIRHARWDVSRTGASVSVSGASLSRADILAMIRTEPGLWVLDFPFGLPSELLRRASTPLNEMHATLKFTRSVAKERFREHCNEVWMRSAAPAPKHRETERVLGCGWFPWFIQLFRQTWTGQTEILHAIRQSNPEIAILPWDSEQDLATQIVEGFPGASLRSRGLPANGYKHRTDQAKAVRRKIVEELQVLGLPLTRNTQEEAIADDQGDLIDALVLLLAGRSAAETDHLSIRAAMDQRGLLGEGWIYQ